MDPNGLPYCAYGSNYTLTDRKLCDTSGLPTAQYTACDLLNTSNPCNSTLDFPIQCVAADDGWTCFCIRIQTFGKDCANLDIHQFDLDHRPNNSFLCRNNASCINSPEIVDFASTAYPKSPSWISFAIFSASIFQRIEYFFFK